MANFNELVANHQKRLIAEELKRIMGDNLRSSSTGLSLSESLPVEAASKSREQSNDSVYKVQCKLMNRFCHIDSNIGDPVVEGSVVIIAAPVEGLEIGVVVRIYSANGFAKMLSMTRPFNDKEEGEIRPIVRLATSEDLKRLPAKYQREEQLLLQCQRQVKLFNLPIDVYGAELQFDLSLLTFYYTSATRVDFREMVRTMQNSCKVRIRMRKTNQCKKFVPVASATKLLQSGIIS